MYNVEKCSAVLENAVGFARLDVYIYGHKMAALGHVFTFGQHTLHSPTLCKLVCHQRSSLRG